MAHNYRFERKFQVPECTRHEICAILRLHPAMFHDIYQPRYVRNIYLDTMDLRNYEDNMDGAGQRQKVRIRWYGPLFGEITEPTLEIKVRHNLLGTKLSYPLAPFRFEQGFELSEIQRVFDRSALPPLLRLQLKDLQPTLVNSYYRSYHLSRDGRFRVTVDSEMEYLGVHPLRNRFLQRAKDADHQVVELKYEESDDSRVRSIATHFPFRLSRNSKYVTGLQLLYA